MATLPLTYPYVFLLFWCVFRKQACWALTMLQAQIRKNPCTVWAHCTGMAKERTGPLDCHNSFWRDTALLSIPVCHETEHFSEYKTSCSSTEMWKDGKPYLNLWVTLGHNQSSSTACPAWLGWRTRDCPTYGNSPSYHLVGSTQSCFKLPSGCKCLNTLDSSTNPRSSFFYLHM